MQPRPPQPPESPGAADTVSQGRPTAHRLGARRPGLPPPAPARAQPTCRPRGEHARLPRCFVPHPGRARSGPCPPARSTPRPGGRSPNVSRLARGLPRAAPSEARFRLPSHSRRPPLRPSGVRPSPPRPASGARVPAGPSRAEPLPRVRSAGTGPERGGPQETRPDPVERRAIDPQLLGNQD